jgi:hypothetical protein
MATTEPKEESKIAETAEKAAHEFEGGLYRLFAPPRAKNEEAQPNLEEMEKNRFPFPLHK